MKDRIDHAAEARRLQGGARDIVRAINGDPALQPHMAAIIMLDDARLEAQLAIAEQLRIQNLVALAHGARGGAIGLEEIALDALRTLHVSSDGPWGNQTVELLPEIREALGLRE